MKRHPEGDKTPAIVKRSKLFTLTKTNKYIYYYHIPFIVIAFGIIVVLLLAHLHIVTSAITIKIAIASIPLVFIYIISLLYSMVYYTTLDVASLEKPISEEIASTHIGTTRAAKWINKNHHMINHAFLIATNIMIPIMVLALILVQIFWYVISYFITKLVAVIYPNIATENGYLFVALISISYFSIFYLIFKFQQINAFSYEYMKNIISVLFYLLVIIETVSVLWFHNTISDTINTINLGNIWGIKNLSYMALTLRFSVYCVDLVASVIKRSDKYRET